MMFFDRLFGWIDRPGSESEDPLEETEQEILEEKVEELAYKQGRLEPAISQNTRFINELEERVDTLEGLDPERKWYESDEYVKTFCPKCKYQNTTKVPVKAKNSMGLTCDNCGIDYRILFETEDE